MRVKNNTADERGFGTDVIGAGETLEVGAAAAKWFLRHGCVEADAKVERKTTKKTSTSR